MARSEGQKMNIDTASLATIDKEQAFWRKQRAGMAGRREIRTEHSRKRHICPDPTSGNSLEIKSLSRHQEADDEAEQAQDGAEDFDDENLDESGRRSRLE